MFAANWILDTTIAALIGFVLDLLIGDPVFAWHPVRLIGKLIAFLEKKFRRPEDSNFRELMMGILLVIIVIAVSGAVPALIMIGLGHVNRILLIAVESLMCWTVLSAKDLKKESMLVYEALKKDDLPGAQKALSRIVGRDTEVLDESGVIRAAVETVAENTSDGEIAPLFFLMIAGPVGGYIYKAVNTMDSMIGYKNRRYFFFGKAAARLDDVFNYIPSRLAAWLMQQAVRLCHLNYAGAVRIHRRDAHKHASPNSAQTESVMAGALDIRLAGDISYGGKTRKKPELGDDLREPEPEDIVRANRVMMMTSVLMLVIFVGVRVIAFLLALSLAAFRNIGEAY